MEKLHQDFISKAMDIFKQDERIEGVAMGGSYIFNTMDQYSDLDMIIVTASKSFNEVMAERKELAAKLGHMLSCFTGEHVGEPRLLICLYGPELLHVDLKFVALEDVQKRVEDPVILWERSNKVSERLKLEEARFPYPDLQWIEDRFWVWVHYGATKLGRRELFEAISLVNHLRDTVLGPLALIKNHKLPRGVRKLEADASEDLEKLVGTVPCYGFESCAKALYEEIQLYRKLRSFLCHEGLIRREEAERLSIEYLDKIVNEAKNQYKPEQ